MSKKLIFFSLALFTNLFVTSELLAQSSRSDSQEFYMIDKNKPSVYIRFDKSGKLEPLRPGDTKERIWLKLYNNTKWKIAFCSFTVNPKYGDVGVTYNIKKIQPSLHQDGWGNEVEEEKAPRLKSTPEDFQILKETVVEKPKIPLGYRTGDTCTPYYIPSGKPILFSIPRKHLLKDLFIEVEFWYEWENRNNELGDFPQLYVSFANSQLPSEERYRNH